MQKLFALLILSLLLVASQQACPTNCEVCVGDLCIECSTGYWLALGWSNAADACTQTACSDDTELLQLTNSAESCRCPDTKFYQDDSGTISCEAICTSDASTTRKAVGYKGFDQCLKIAACPADTYADANNDCITIPNCRVQSDKACTTCYTDATKDDTGDVDTCTCPATTYVDHATFTCKTIDSCDVQVGKDCTTCYTGATKDDTGDVDTCTCPATTYSDSTSKTCKTIPNCDVQSGTTCTTCYTGANYDDSGAVDTCTCPTDTYPDSTSKTCKTIAHCDDQSGTTCTTCEDGYVNVEVNSIDTCILPSANGSQHIFFSFALAVILMICIFL